MSTFAEPDVRSFFPGAKLARWLLCPSVVGLAHIVFIVEYLERIWQYEHYRFLPFAFAFSGALFVSRSARSTDRHWKFRPVALVIVSLALLTAAVFLQSPWVGWLSFLCAIGAGLLGSTDRETGQSLWHLWLPVLLTLRLPLGRDLQLVEWLQRVTSSLSSAILNGAGIMHHMSGNILHLPDRQLFVEEACSGVQSVFTLMFLSAVYCALERRSVVRCLILGACGFFWAGMLNVMRVTGIALAHHHFQVDLATGWPHELFGYCALLLAFALLVSTDRLLYFGLSPVTERARCTGNRIVLLWNRLVQFGAAEPQNDVVTNTVTHPDSIGRLALLSLAFLIVGGVGFCSERNAKPALISQFIAESNTFPQVAQWKIKGFEQTERSISSSRGRFSEAWQLDGPVGDCKADLAYPFGGWHDLAVCYRSAGWSIDRRVVTADDPAWPCVELWLSNTNNDHGYVVFSQFDAKGCPVIPADEEIHAGFVDRLRGLGGLSGQVLQFQLARFDTDPIPDSDRLRLLNHHLQTRGELCHNTCAGIRRISP